MPEHVEKQAEHIEESELIRQRRAKLDDIAGRGIYPYGGRYDTTSTIKELKDDFSEGKQVSLAGRIMAARSHGKSSFYDVKDSTGKIQAYLKEDIVGAEKFGFLNPR